MRSHITVLRLIVPALILLIPFSACRGDKPIQAGPPEDLLSDRIVSLMKLGACGRELNSGKGRY